jgi:hypothetical protein
VAFARVGPTRRGALTPPPTPLEAGHPAHRTVLSVVITTVSSYSLFFAANFISLHRRTGQNPGTGAATVGPTRNPSASSATQTQPAQGKTPASSRPGSSIPDRSRTCNLRLRSRIASFHNYKTVAAMGQHQGCSVIVEGLPPRSGPSAVTVALHPGPPSG